MTQPNKVMIVDLETENHVYFGAMASPRHPDNFVVAIGQAIEDVPYSGEITGQYYPTKESVPADWLTIPDDVWLLVAHNAAFEMDWFLVKARDEIMRFLKRGGRIFCTAYAEYLLTNQQETYPALDSTAPKYGGTHKVDGIKALWEQGVLTSQIDKHLLFDEYLIGPEGDIANTRLTFYGQYAKLQERGMLNMVFARCEGLLFNTFAMDAGLHVNKTIAEQQKAEGEAKIAALVQGFKQFRTHIPEYVEFKESSDYHMSAWLYGGPIKYRIRDTWFEEDGVTPKYERVDCFKFGDTLVQIPDGISGMSPEQFEQCVSQYGAPDRYKAGKNKGQIKVHSVPGSTPKQKWYERQLPLTGIVDFNLLPADVRREFLKEFSGKRKLCDGVTPVYSTGSDAIEALSKRQEFPEEVRTMLKQLLEFAKLDKDMGTYYLRDKCDEEGNVVKQSGMLQYLTPQCIVYHVLNTTSTVTTRLSGTRPNMQNIPRGDTSDVKKMFTSRFDDPVWLAWALEWKVIPQDVYDECMALINSGERAGDIIEADYSALEVVTLAAFSKDRALIDALLAGTDMHCLRLSKKLGESYESVLMKCKDENHPEHKAYKTMRTDIKPPSFAYQYGATAMGIAFATGCTVEYAEEFIANEKALFPEVETFYVDKVFSEVNATRTLHREQTESGAWRVFGRGHWTSPAGTRYEFREYPKAQWVDGQRIETMEFKPTQMRNYPIQGESGFFVQGMAGLVVRWLISKDFFGGRVFIINQVHDALYLDCCRSVMREVALTVKAIMESLPEHFKAYGYDLGVPFPAEVEAGPSMYDKSKVH